MQVTIKSQAEAALQAIRLLREELAAVRQANADLTFSVTNVSVDEKARNPAHRIYYYDAVDRGRVAITAGANQSNNYPNLHFRTEAGWVVTKNVKSTKPGRGITRAAQELLPAALEEVRASVAGIVNPAQAVSGLMSAYKSAVLRVYRQATIDSVEEQNTKGRFYGVTSIPLASGFRIVQGGQIEEPV